jgi:hypothetical protein
VIVLALGPPLALHLVADTVAGEASEHLNQVLALDDSMLGHILQGEFLEGLLVKYAASLLHCSCHLLLLLALIFIIINLIISLRKLSKMNLNYNS